MSNPGVKCNVCECKHNKASNMCDLTSIEVTHEKTGADAVATPHFCKSYCQK
ncbi:MAG: DUF1540 domain-containing protein [Clostridium sp.]